MVHRNREKEAKSLRELRQLAEMYIGRRSFAEDSCRSAGEMVNVNTTTREELVKDYSELVQSHHPELSKRDRHALVEKLVDITERFVTALAVAVTKNGLASSAYSNFKRELETLPKWFEAHLRKR